MVTGITFDPGNTLSLAAISTPPSSYRTHWTYEGSFNNSISGGLLLRNALAKPLATACFPPGFSSAGRASLSQVYSPGQCPIGYATPAQYQSGAITRFVCCPSWGSMCATWPHVPFADQIIQVFLLLLHSLDNRQLLSNDRLNLRRLYQYLAQSEWRHHNPCSRQWLRHIVSGDGIRPAHHVGSAYWVRFPTKGPLALHDEHFRTYFFS